MSIQLCETLEQYVQRLHRNASVTRVIDKSDFDESAAFLRGIPYRSPELIRNENRSLAFARLERATNTLLFTHWRKLWHNGFTVLSFRDFVALQMFRKTFVILETGIVWKGDL